MKLGFPFEWLDGAEVQYDGILPSSSSIPSFEGCLVFMCQLPTFLMTEADGTTGTTWVENKEINLLA